MRANLTAVSLLLVLGAEAANAAGSSGDFFSGLRFSDNVERNAASFGDSAVVFVRFCGHCPGAAATMRSEVKAIHDRVEKERLPVLVVCTTPDKSPSELAAYQKQLAMPGALFAQDVANSGNISLNNIMQAYGLRQGSQIAYLSGDIPAEFTKMLAGPAKAAQHRFPVDGLTTDQGKELWWYVERGKPQGVRSLVTAAKGSSPLKADAERILAVVQATALKRQEAALAAPASIATVESLEALLSDGDGLDLKPAQDRLKALLATPELKDELQARAIFRKIEALIAEARAPKAKEEAKTNFKTLGEKFPATVYGQRAAQVK